MKSEKAETIVSAFYSSSVCSVMTCNARFYILLAICTIFSSSSFR